MALTPEEAELLARMRADNQAAGFPFAPEGWWEWVTKEFDKRFASEGIGDVETQWYNSHFSCYPDKGHPVWAEYACFLMYAWIMDGPAGDILGRVNATGGHLYPTPDGPVSWDFLLSLDTLGTLDLASGLGLFDGPVTVVDLGAGWGRIGHVLCKANPQATYIDCDLPEPLLIAATYLPRVLDCCHPYGEQPDGPGAYFLGAQGFGDLPDGSVDAVVNVASFQEMTKAQAEAYYGIIERKASWLYTQQARLPHPYPERWEAVVDGAAVWSPLYHEKVFRL